MSKEKKKKKDNGVVDLYLSVDDEEVHDAIDTAEMLVKKVKELQKAARKLNAQLSSLNIDIQPVMRDLVTNCQDCHL